MGQEGGSAETPRADAILGSVAFAAERLVEAASWEDCAREVLLAVGRAAGAGSASIFENSTDDGRLSMVERFRWAEHGPVETLERAGAPKVGYLDRYERFFETLSA